MFFLFFVVLPVLMTIELVCIVKSRTWDFKGFPLFLFILNSLAMSYLLILFIEATSYYGQ